MIITDVENTWLISDTHFGHENITKLCKRPDNVDMLMIAEWSRLVPAGATLLHLGDLAYRADFREWKAILSALPGNKHLILGNHDKQPAKYYESCGFKIIEPFDYRWGSYNISFSHYPLESRAFDHELHIHGHIHNNGYGGESDIPGSPARESHINISVEVTKYRPVHLGTLLRAYFS